MDEVELFVFFITLPRGYASPRESSCWYSVLEKCCETPKSFVVYVHPSIRIVMKDL